jgi:hypothetical protein
MTYSAKRRSSLVLPIPVTFAPISATSAMWDIAFTVSVWSPRSLPSST